MLPVYRFCRHFKTHKLFVAGLRSVQPFWQALDRALCSFSHLHNNEQLTVHQIWCHTGTMRLCLVLYTVRVFMHDPGGIKVRLRRPSRLLQSLDTVSWVIWPVEALLKMTYNVSSGTPRLYSLTDMIKVNDSHNKERLQLWHDIQRKLVMTITIYTFPNYNNGNRTLNYLQSETLGIFLCTENA